MRKKTIISGVLAASLTLAATMGGCSLVSTNNIADMEQVIATVDISKAGKFENELEPYKDAVGETKVIKRELVSYFLNVGYSYVQSGSSYSDVFKMLTDSLVNNAVLTQYATMYLLNEKATENANAVAEYNACTTEAAKYEYLLGGKDSEDVKLAEYSLRYSINAAIDSYEKNILEDEDSSAGSETRATPENIDTEKENYYPVREDGEVDYNIYTGFEGYLLSDSGAYAADALEGSTKATRIRAYNSFVSSLISYNLVDASKENLRDVRSLEYFDDEYVSQLKSRLINKYYDLYEAEQEEKLKNGEQAFEYIQAVYDDLFDMQKESYKTKESFAAAYKDMSDSSFILYAPNTEDDGTYGFVYNILLPFSATQNAKLTELKALYADSETEGYKPEYYTARNALLKNIKTTDQRSAWFNGEKDYAFNAKAGGLDYYGNSGYLFFENNLTNNSRYESLKKYDGRYSYNGIVVEKENDYVLLPEELNINDMLKEFSDYVKYVSGCEVNYFYDESAYYKTYTEDNLYKSGSDDKEVDYANFVYATGVVDFGADEAAKTEAYNRANLLNKESSQYKALSAVNELQYAYTTDTGVLSQYLGYNVDVGTTSYIKEFEYVSQKAIENGAGSFAVCAGDYGWHLIYVTYTFDNNAVNGVQYTPDWSKVAQEGTFENLFYEWIKSNDIEDASTARSNWITKKYIDDDTVVKYEDRYRDLLDLA